MIQSVPSLLLFVICLAVYLGLKNTVDDALTNRFASWADRVKATGYTYTNRHTAFTRALARRILDLLDFVFGKRTLASASIITSATSSPSPAFPPSSLPASTSTAEIGHGGRQGEARSASPRPMGRRSTSTCPTRPHLVMTPSRRPSGRPPPSWPPSRSRPRLAQEPFEGRKAPSRLRACRPRLAEGNRQPIMLGGQKPRRSPRDDHEAMDSVPGGRYALDISGGFSASQRVHPAPTVASMWPAAGYFGGSAGLARVLGAPENRLRF